MTVRLDVRPRPAIVLGPPTLARRESGPAVSGWLGSYWLAGVALAALCYFDVIPVAQLFQRGAAASSEIRPTLGGEIEPAPVRAAWLGAASGAEGGERVGTTEPLELSRAAYRGVHYGGGEELPPSGDSASLADAELALLDPSAPGTGLGQGRGDLLGGGRAAVAARDPADRPGDRADRRGSRSRRRSRPASHGQAGGPSPLGASDPVASLGEAPSNPPPGALDGESARIAALSRAVDSALGRSLPRPEAERSDDEAEPAPSAAAGRWQRASSGPSCEGAAASYREEIRIGGESGPPDLSREQYARVLNRGSYFRHCGAPSSMGIRICAAVQNGRAEGVTVWTDPGDSAVGSCVAAAVRGLSFPSHPRLDVTTTTFAPVR